MFRPTDTRSDLGYARLSAKPTQSGMVGSNSWPFLDDFEEVEYTEKELEMRDLIQNKTLPPISDYGDISGLDREATHDIIKVESAVAKGISPFPRMYRKREGHLGSLGKSIANSHSLGFRVDNKFSGHNYNKEVLPEDEPVYTLEDLALKQLRECIRHMILEYYE